MNHIELIWEQVKKVFDDENFAKEYVKKENAEQIKDLFLTKGVKLSVEEAQEIMDKLKETTKTIESVVNDETFNEQLWKSENIEHIKELFLTRNIILEDKNAQIFYEELENLKNNELSEEDLEDVAGGFNTIYRIRCFCGTVIEKKGRIRFTLALAAHNDWCVICRIQRKIVTGR